jgi:hypothetical protein
MSRQEQFLAKLARYRALTDHEAEADRRIAAGLVVDEDGVHWTPIRGPDQYVALGYPPRQRGIRPLNAKAEQARRERETFARRRATNREIRGLVRALRKGPLGKAIRKAEGDHAELAPVFGLG